MNSHEIWKSDSWNLLYKLLRSKERRMMMMKKMMTARLYIYFPYGEISNKMCLGFCGKTNMAMVVSMVILNKRPQGLIELRYLGSCLNNA